MPTDTCLQLGNIHVLTVLEIESQVVFYWDEPFQPQPVWVDLMKLLALLKRTLFQLFSVETH